MLTDTAASYVFNALWQIKPHYPRYRNISEFRASTPSRRISSIPRKASSLPQHPRHRNVSGSGYLTYHSLGNMTSRYFIPPNSREYILRLGHTPYESTVSNITPVYTPPESGYIASHTLTTQSPWELLVFEGLALSGHKVLRAITHTSISISTNLPPVIRVNPRKATPASPIFRTRNICSA